MKKETVVFVLIFETDDAGAGRFKYIQFSDAWNCTK